MISLIDRLKGESNDTQVKGTWQSISYCFDELANDFLNVGVLFNGVNGREVRMIDTLDRIECLYDKRFSKDDLLTVFHDIETCLINFDEDLPDCIGDDIRLGPKLYAAGNSAEEIVDSFFDDVVTLGRLKNRTANVFRYTSTAKLEKELISHIRQTMRLDAERIVQNEPFVVRMNTGARIPVELPFISERACGGIVSAWYKSPLVVENNILKVASDINLVRATTNRQISSVSVLTPPEDCGLSQKEFRKLSDTTRRQLDRLNAQGIDIVEAHSTADLAVRTENWWRAA